MKKYFVILACSVFGAALAQSQTQSSPSSPATTQPGTQSPTRGVQQSETGRITPARPGVSTERETIFNQPAGANRPEPIPPTASTNPVLPNTTNPIIVNPTNPFIVDPSGAANQRFQTNQQPGSLTNRIQNPTAVEQAFTQRLRAAAMQNGSHQIFSPQSQSIITIVNQNGVVTLQGTVRNEGEKQSIEARLKGMQGITSIDNQLQVSAPRQLPPAPAPAAPAPAPSVPGSEDERRLLNP